MKQVPAEEETVKNAPRSRSRTRERGGGGGGGGDDRERGRTVECLIANRMRGRRGASGIRRKHKRPKCRLFNSRTFEWEMEQRLRLDLYPICSSFLFFLFLFFFFSTLPLPPLCIFSFKICWEVALMSNESNNPISSGDTPPPN